MSACPVLDRCGVERASIHPRDVAYAAVCIVSGAGRSLALDAIHRRYTSCILVRMAILSARLAIDRESVAKYVHADRYRRRRGLLLQHGRHASAGHFPLVVGGAWKFTRYVRDIYPFRAMMAAAVT